MGSPVAEITRQLAEFADPPAHWRDLALSGEVDPELFFPEKGGSARAAKRVCAACEVGAECLAYALDHGERFGIWSGRTERERRRLAQQQRRCPRHGVELSGGPVLWHCPAGTHGHAVTAADLQAAAETRQDAA